MAQTLLQLITEHDIADGVFVKLAEMISGVTTNVIYRVHGHNMHECGEDSVMLVRGTVHDQRQMHSTNKADYANSQIDTWLNSTFKDRLSPWVQDLILTAPILIKDYEDETIVPIDRKVFLPSYTEWGYGQEYGIASPYTTTNAKRIMYNKIGTASYFWLRTRCGATNYYYVSDRGSIGGNNVAQSLMYVIPSFDIPSSLPVGSTPDPDGSYRLLDPDASELPGVDITARAAITDSRPTAARAECDLTGADSVQLWLCNNFDDAAPAWETAILGTSHEFSNAAKTADHWAIGIRLIASGESTVTAREPYVIYSTERGTSA